MNIKMKLAGLFLGALLATTSAFAAESTTGTPKCGAEMKKEMKDEMKDAKETVKGSCGAGKCGSK